MIRGPPRSTRTDTLFPTPRSSDLIHPQQAATGKPCHRRGMFGKRATIELPPSRHLDNHRHLQPRAEQRADCTQRSEEHTSELQSQMRTPYAAFCVKTKNNIQKTITTEARASNKHMHAVSRT